MGLEAFTLATIADMDCGRIRVAFEHALARCQDDCKDRPDLKTSRKIALVLHLEPVCEKGRLESVDVTFKITDTIPKRESKSYNMKAVAGGLLFNEASPDDVRQMTIDMAPKPTLVTDEEDEEPPRSGKDAAYVG